jgi:photosystem II stability/assembly factor-like uncharacterized protein
MIGASAVDPVTAVVVLVLAVAAVGLALWAIRSQARMFPKDFDRTGWNPERSDVGWFRTKFTWLSGGRG